MPDRILERRLWLPRPRGEVFEFFAAARSLEQVNPPWARPRWLSPPPSRLSAGTVLDFRVGVVGFPCRWRVIIREFDPPYRFVDAQLWGPFTRWEHRHRFLEGPEGAEAPGPIGTWVEDRVTYRLPLGVLGGVAHALGAGRRVAALFDHRDRRLGELLGAR